MPTAQMPPSTAFEAAAREALVSNLRNTHALEKQAIAVMESQLKLLTDYPELHARMTEHIVETREQARRLEAGLEACGDSASLARDTLLSVMGLGQSSIQGFSDDAVLKAVAADMMTEHLEIATYRTLLALADMAGKPELRPRLEDTLREEEAMATWFEQNLDAITRRFVEIKAAELQAHAARRNDSVPPDDDSVAEPGATPEPDDSAPAPQTPRHPETKTPAAGAARRDE